MPAHDVLVLDIGYQPVSRMSWRRALRLWLDSRVEIIEKYNDEVRSASLIWQRPAVVRWLTRIGADKRNAVRFSREAVYLRDRGMCAYCWAHVPSSKYTLDHVTPRALGGSTCFENVVLACATCNLRKGCKTLKEAGLRLIVQPERPARYLPYGTILAKQKNLPEQWRKWVLYADWAAEILTTQEQEARQ